MRKPGIIELQFTSANRSFRQQRKQMVVETLNFKVSGLRPILGKLDRRALARASQLSVVEQT